MYLEVDGKPHPATDCHWLEISPCGCIAGISRAAYRTGRAPDIRIEVRYSGEDAFFDDRPKAVREYELNRGLRYQLITNEQYRATYAEQMSAKCSHTPKWGIEPLPVPDGWVWKTVDGSAGRSTYRRHLVPTEITDRYADVAALCGKKAGGWRWSDDWHRMYDTVPCSKCVKRAGEVAL